MPKQTITLKLAEIRKTSMLAHADKLEAIKAPQITIDNIRKMAENPLKGVGKLKEFGHLVVTDYNEAKGYGGKPYIRFFIEGQKDVLYVNGRYGWYLKVAVKGQE